MAIRVDEDLIRQLAKLLEETGLTEIEITVGRHHVRVGRGATTVGQAVASLAPESPAADTESTSSAPEPGSMETYADHPGTVTAPMVGTLYLAPSPEADPFVQPGQEVKEGDQLFLIEAMKTMNPIAAHCSGTLLRVFGTNASPVEYGAVLAVIE